MKETKEKRRVSSKKLKAISEIKKIILHKNLNTGITLIALVVTIVVLLILAGITINMLFSNGGIFKTAKDAANTWNEATSNEPNSNEPRRRDENR
jgi:flagellar basal body-associated protein FliL